MEVRHVYLESIVMLKYDSHNEPYFNSHLRLDPNFPVFKVSATGYVTPYGGAPVTGLTNLLYEVCASH